MEVVSPILFYNWPLGSWLTERQMMSKGCTIFFRKSKVFRFQDTILRR